jgi:hypothetical protein
MSPIPQINNLSEEDINIIRQLIYIFYNTTENVNTIENDIIEHQNITLINNLFTNENDNSKILKNIFFNKNIINLDVLKNEFKNNNIVKNIKTNSNFNSLINET